MSERLDCNNNILCVGVNVEFTGPTFALSEDESVPVCIQLSGPFLARSVIASLQLSTNEGNVAMQWCRFFNGWADFTGHNSVP